ncbi:hypothetical protein [Streptomyces sp. CoT10]|uniref:hypothetical protein n=1 Tax=Streptomyces sp. CoT10 TaxID=2875762 RepID=UPI001CD574FC|nr:hypothetical protein [Streptomyces sp. CoT10]
MTSNQTAKTDAERKAFYRAVSILGVLADFYVKTIESPDTPEDRHSMESAASENARKFAYDLLDRLKAEGLLIVPADR